MPVFVKSHVRAGKSVKAYRREGTRQQRLNSLEASLSRHLGSRKWSTKRFNEIRETRRRAARMRMRQVMFGF